MASEHGYVYLLQSPTKAWKIGKASSPSDRLRTFEVKLPFEVEFAHLIYCYNMGKLERELHLIFQKRRINGEWFDLTENDVNWIKRFECQTDFDVITASIDNMNVNLGHDQTNVSNYRQQFVYPITRKIVYIILLSAFMGSCVFAINYPSMRADAAVDMLAALILVLINAMDIMNLLREFAGVKIDDYAISPIEADTQPMSAVDPNEPAKHD